MPRRMEVYTKLIDQDSNIYWELQSKIMDENSFDPFQEPVYIFGNGMPKFRDISNQENLIFINDIFPDAFYYGCTCY